MISRDDLLLLQDKFQTLSITEWFWAVQHLLIEQMENATSLKRKTAFHNALEAWHELQRIWKAAKGSNSSE